MISAKSVRAIFDENGINNVAIIDDVFDPPGQNMSETERETLYEQFTSIEGLTQSLKHAKIPFNEPDDLTEKAITEIKRLSDAGADHAREAWMAIEAISSGRRTALEKFADTLQKSLELSVKTISAKKAKEDEKDVVPNESNVIFLDYELEVGSGAGELSSSIVKKIYEQFKGKESAPLLILMSSLKLDVDTIASFQKRSDFLSGMFYFVSKDDLFENGKLNYRLAAFAKALPTGQKLQQFVESIDSSLQKVRMSVFNDLRSLSIADYAFLQTTRLHDDGQPMGEYLMWMISSHLVKELSSSSAMQKLEREVDKLTFEHLPPTQAKPSSSLGALYSSAVLRPIGELPDTATDSANYLQFGDLFRKGSSKDVWICITPPCDLAFGPSRPIPSSRSILFLPGKLVPIDKALTPFEQRQPRTELVRLGEDMYRIIWNTKGVLQIKWKELKDCLFALKAKRVARLNTAFALEIQRGFATDLTRIGMPVPPPIYNPVKIQLSCLDKNDAEITLTTAETSTAHLDGSERGERLVLGAEFMDGLPEMLAKASEVLAARHVASQARESEQGPGPAASAQIQSDGSCKCLSLARIVSAGFVQTNGTGSAL